MAPNSRFAVAVHAVTTLAYLDGDSTTSDQLARSIRTNAVVVRRILGALVKAKLVECRKGKSGGSRLARRPEEITLLDIYRAIEQDGLFAVPEKAASKSCPVACRMKGLLSTVFKQAESSMEESLRQTRISDLVKKI